MYILDNQIRFVCLVVKTDCSQLPIDRYKVNRLGYQVRFLYLVVDESPLLQEGVNPHDGAHVSGQVTTASRAKQN